VPVRDDVVGVVQFRFIVRFTIDLLSMFASILRWTLAMTYDQADNILKGRDPDRLGAAPPPPLTAGGPVDRGLIGPLRDSLTILTTLARTLRKDREDVGGAVDLSSGDLGNELKFTIVDGNPTKVLPKVEKEIHHTIAELMILANTTVADKISEQFPESALLRIHRTVDEDRFGELREVLEAYGISFHGSTNADLAATLKKASTKHPTVDALLKSFATRAMSEAQYVCTGDISNLDGLSHYGLGLKKYTHFTSPIRRYADVVVHKQLLAALENDQNGPGERLTNAPTVPSAPLASLPGSNVVSILEGEGLEGASGESEDDLIDSLIEGASELVLESKHPTAVVATGRDPIQDAEADDTRKPYVAFEVTHICDGLNLHNRLAKYSSSECQKLFLSLYFRDHYEVTQAVVVKLRTNGFWSYVPKFDLRAPVYLIDKDDRLQVDPALLGLPSDAGMPCSDGFGDHCRLFPQGQCELFAQPDEALVISVPETNVNVRVRQLDVVSVQLACGRFDLRARIPSPRAYLLAKSTASAAVREVTSSTKERIVVTSGYVQAKGEANGKNPETSASGTEPSFFQLVSSMTKCSRVANLVNEFKQKGVVAASTSQRCTIPGRLVFGDFVNPNTRSARQEHLQKLAAADSAQRRSQIQSMASRRGEYDATSRLEREATARQQRLIADKRNARRSKAK
jgi:RNB domain